MVSQVHAANVRQPPLRLGDVVREVVATVVHDVSKQHASKQRCAAARIGRHCVTHAPEQGDNGRREQWRKHKTQVVHGSLVVAPVQAEVNSDGKRVRRPRVENEAVKRILHNCPCKEPQHALQCARKWRGRVPSQRSDGERAGHERQPEQRHGEPWRFAERLQKPAVKHEQRLGRQAWPAKPLVVAMPEPSYLLNNRQPRVNAAHSFQGSAVVRKHSVVTAQAANAQGKQQASGGVAVRMPTSRLLSQTLMMRCKHAKHKACRT